MTSANTDNSFASIDYEEMVRQRNEERQVLKLSFKTLDYNSIFSGNGNTTSK